MIVEMLCRNNAPLDDETIQLIDKEIENGRIIDSDYNEVTERARLTKKHRRYTYKPMTFDIKDVARYELVDAKHTYVRFVDGDEMDFKIAYDAFQSIHITLLGINIHKFTDVNKENKILDGQ